MKEIQEKSIFIRVNSARFELSGVDCFVEFTFVIFWIIVRAYSKKINNQIIIILIIIIIIIIIYLLSIAFTECFLSKRRRKSLV